MKCARTVFALLALTLTACGSSSDGDSGDSFVGAALVALQISPSSIDTGDRTRVTVDISDVHDNGISLKIRFPSGLRYVASSAVLQIEDADLDVSPTVNVNSSNQTFLVFYFDSVTFSEFSGKLTLELEGTKIVRDGEIEIDADVDDPDIGNDVEFSPDAPEFDAEESASIQVRSDSSDN